MKYLFFLIFIVACGSLRPKAPEKKSDFFKVLWAKNLDSDYQSGNLPIGLGAPRIFNDIVYMGSMSGVISAYDVESGRVLWSHDEKTPLGGAVEFFKDHVS
jgi:hypothetical protein